MKKILILLFALALVTMAFADTVQVGTGTATTSNLPISGNWGYTYSQQIYTQAQIAKAGEITKLRFYYVSGTITNSKDWVIYMGHTTKTTFATTTDWEPLANLTQVFAGDVSSMVPLANNWMEITLTTPFEYNNTDNLIIAVDENTSGYATMSWGAFTSGSNTGIYYRNDSNNPDPAAPPVATSRVADINRMQFVFPSTTAPLAPTLVSPANGGESFTNGKLSWTATSGGADTDSYDVYFGTSATPPLVSSGQTETFYVPALTAGTTYYWNVVAHNGIGASLASPTWNFTAVSGVAIGEGTVTSLNLPLNPYYGYNYSQTLYLQSEINTFGQRVEKLYYHWNGLAAGTNTKDWAIYMGHTDKSAFASTTDWVPFGNMIEVFNGEVNLPATAGWIEITLMMPFVYNNTDNLVIAVNEFTSGDDGNSAKFFGTSTASNRGLRIQTDGSAHNPAEPGTGTLVSGIANIRMKFGDLPSSPILSVNPEAWDFGNRIINTSISKEFTIGNTGAGQLNVSNLSIDGIGFTLAEAFSPVSLLMGETANFTVNYLPTTPGNHTATITISDNRAVTLIELSGSAYDPTITSLPYSENFDGTWSGSPAAPLDWTVINADSDGYTWRQGNNYITPTHSEPNAAVGMGNTNDWMITPPINLTGVNARLKWWDKVESATKINTYTVYVSTTDSAIASFTTSLGTFDCANTDWTEHTLNLDAYNGSTIYLAFHQTASPSTFYGFGIDDFLLEEIPDNPIFSYTPASIDFGTTQANTPTAYSNVVVSNIGGATLNLTAANISLIGTHADQFAFTTTTGFPAALTGGQSVSIPVRFNPTTAGTKTASLRISYGGDNYDVALSGIALAENSLVEGFEGGVIPSNWTVLNEDGGSKVWNVTTNNPHTGAYSARVQYETSSLDNDDWLITPPLVVTSITTDVISFWMRTYSATDGDAWQVLISTTDTNPASFTMIDSGTGQLGEYVQKSYNLDSYGDAIVYLAVRYMGSYNWYLYVDDFVGPPVYVPTGPPNPVTLLSPANGAIDVPKTGFSLSWTPASIGGVPTSYTIYMASSEETIYDENVFNDITATSFNPISEGLLTFEFEDRWFWTVEAVNSFGSAVPDAPFQFQIMADPAITTFPWSEGFESASFPPSGWSMRDADADGYNWQIWNLDGSTHTGNNSAASASYINGIGDLTPDNWLITPPATIPATGEYQVEYYVSAQDPGWPEENYGFYVSTTGTAVEDFSLLMEETLEDGDWHHRMQNLATYAGETLYFAFRHFDCTGNYWMKIDDVGIREVPQTPIFSYTPAAWDFGEAQVMNPTTPKSFVLSNTGVGTITINSGDIVLNQSGTDFVLTADNLPASLTGNATYTFTVGFVPQSIGTKTASITIQDNLGRALHTIQLSGEVVAEPIASVLALEAEVEGANNARLNWASVYGDPSQAGYVHWDDSIHRGSVGAGANSFNVVAKYLTLITAQADGMVLDGVMIHLNEAPAVVDAINVWTGTDADLAPTELTHTQAVSGLALGWNYIALTTPVPISGSDALYVGYHVTGIADTHPASTDGLTGVNGFGNVLEMNGSWDTLTGSDIAGNWMIHAHFAQAAPLMLGRRSHVSIPTPVENVEIDKEMLRNLQISPRTNDNVDRVLRGFNIYRDGVQINPATVAAYSYLDEDLPIGIYNYAVQAVHYSANGPISASVPLAIENLPPAPFALPFTETWDSEDFDTNMWTAGSTNWVISTSNGSPAPAASFSWTPGVTDYDIPLTSYKFDATGIDNVQFSFDLALNNYSTDAENLMIWEVWDGTEWIFLGGYSSLNDDLGWSRFAYDISAYASNRIFKIRFTAAGEDSFEINNWYIDNIHLAELPVSVDPVTDLSIAYDGTNVILSWTAVPAADWYYIYTSEDPYTGFTSLGFTEDAGITLPATFFPEDKTFIKVTAGAGPFPDEDRRLSNAPAAIRK